MPFKPGESGNPRGRPRTGLAFAERVRERVDPDLVIDLALRVASDEEMPPAERLAALLPLIDRGFVKPPTTIAARVESTTSGTRPEFASMSLDEIEAEIARCRSLLETGSPLVTVEESRIAQLPPTTTEIP